MNTGTTRCLRSILWCICWQNYCIDDMDDSVACCHIWKCDGGTVHHDGIADCEGKLLVVDCGCFHAIAEVCGENFARYNVVEQDVAQLRLTFRCVERSEIDSCISKGLIGWREHREWPLALKRFKQPRLNDGRYERVVDACTLCSSWNIIRCVGWCQDLVNDVNDTVASGNICHRDGRTIDGDCIANAKRKCVTINGGCRSTFFNGRRRNFTRYNVIEQDIGQHCFPLCSIE